MPYNVTIPYDLNIWNIFFDTVRTSIRSISGMGFYILAFFIGWVVLTAIVNHFTSIGKFNNAVKKRSFTRKVFEADYSRNLDELVEDGVRHGHVRLLTSKAIGERHMDLEVDNKVHSMEVTHKAKMKFAEKNPDAFREEKDLYKRQSSEYYQKRGRSPKK